MPRQRFKSAATSRGFKGIGQSLQASRGEIEKKTRRDVDALKLSKMQAAENAKSYIGGLADAGRFEENVLKEKHRLEDKVRTQQYSALSIKADRDVDRLKGEAEEARKYADHWKDLAPKMAKVAGEFTLGALTLEDQLRGIAEWNKLYDSGQLHKHLGKHGKIVNLTASSMISDAGSLPPDEALAVVDRLRLTSRYAQRKLLNWVKENKTQIGDEVRTKWNSANKANDPNNLDPYGEKTAVIAMDTAARELLKQLGIKESSNAGVAIIEQYRALGSLDQIDFRLKRLFKETETRRLDLVQQFKAAPKGSVDEKVLFNELFLATRNGTFKVNGKIQDVNRVGVMDPADAMVETLRFIATNDPSVNANNLEEEFAEYYTIPISKDNMTAKSMAALKNFKPELVVQKLKGSGRWDNDVVNYVANLGNERTRLENGKKRSASIAFNAKGSDFSNKVEEVLGDGIKTSAEVYSLIDMVENNPNLDAQGRANAFKKFGYIIGNNSNYTNGGHMKNVLRLFSEGKYEEGLEIYAQTKGGLTQAEKDFLNREVKFFQQLESVIPATVGGGATGAEGLVNMVKSKLLTREKENRKTGGKKLSGSGNEKVYEAAARIIKELKATEFVQQQEGEKPSAVPFKDRFDIAKNAEFKLIDSAGVIRWKKDSSGQFGYDYTGLSAEQTNNPYNYIKYGKPGNTTGSYIYPGPYNQDEIDEAKAISQIAETEKLTELTNLDFLDIDKGDGEGLIPLNTDYMKHGLTAKVPGGIYTRGDYLGNPRLTGDLTAWTTALKLAAEGKEYTLPPWPANIVAMSEIPIDDFTAEKVTNYYTKRKLMQDHLRIILKDPTIVIPDTNEDQLADSYGDWFLPRNSNAIAIFSACGAQGVACQSYAAALSLEGLGSQESFFSRYPDAANDPIFALQNGAAFTTNMFEPQMTRLTERLRIDRGSM